jgi:uncharacterized repeat protein (TIGR01451 family)
MEKTFITAKSNVKKIFNSILFVFLLLPIFSFAQNHDSLVPLAGSSITLETSTTTKPTDRCTEWNNLHAVYSWRDIDYRARSTPKNQHQIFTKLTKTYIYWPINNLRFPFISNIIPKQGTPWISSQWVYIFDNDLGKYIWNTWSQRWNISSQIAIEAIFRTINPSSTTRTNFQYFYTATPNNTATTTFNDPNFKDNYIFPTNNILQACNNYYVAYCGDGIVDKISWDGVTDGQWWILKKDLWMQEFLTWYANSSPLIDEVCDDWALNGQAGKCKTDCTGTWNGTETGSMIVTKTLTVEQNYAPQQNLQFRISFSNPGSQILQNVSIEDFLPSWFEYISSEINGVTNALFSTGMVQWNLRIAYTGFSLNAWQNGYILINAKLLACNAALNNVFWSAISNGVSITGHTTKQVNCSTTPVSINKSGLPNTIQWGQTVRFTITANNATPNTITNVRVEDVWPSCFSLVEWSVTTNIQASQTAAGNMTQWTLPNWLTPGQSFIVSFSWLANTSAGCVGTHTNTWRIIFTDGQWVAQTQTNTSVTISQASHQMSITKRVEGPTTAWPGDDVVFVIEYRNNGTTTINGFRIIDHRPSSLQFRTSILASTNLNINNRIVNINTTPLVWNFADTILQPGQSDSIKITWTIKQNIQ